VPVSEVRLETVPGTLPEERVSSVDIVDAVVDVDGVGSFVLPGTGNADSLGEIVEVLFLGVAANEDEWASELVDVVS